MDETTWSNICDVVLQEMKDHIEPFLSPIWKFKNEEKQKHHGTGTYLEYLSQNFLITNEHVARSFETNCLTHSFHGSEKILVITNKFLYKAHPIDVAISKIENSIWSREVCQGQAIPLSRFDEKHEPLEGELLFFAGFSGQRAKTVFSTMNSRGTPFLTQECPLPESVEEVNSEFHLSIPYPTELSRSTDPSVPLPYPRGFSGSLLWNTKRVECLHANKIWQPSMAKVTGIVWGWPSSKACIIATKVEHMHIKEMVESYG